MDLLLRPLALQDEIEFVTNNSEQQKCGNITPVHSEPAAKGHRSVKSSHKRQKIWNTAVFGMKQQRSAHYIVCTVYSLLALVSEQYVKLCNMQQFFFVLLSHETILTV